jgi:glycosyltransferase involved in cell wall biosynthesis
MTELKIGYDAKRIFNNASGLGNYARQLVWNIASLYPQHQFNLYTPKIKMFDDFGKSLKNIKIVKKVSGVSWWWRSFGIKEALLSDNIQVYHGLSHEIPFSVPDSVRTVVTIHDLIWLKLPHLYPVTDRQIYTFKARHACKNADKIIAISQQTADDIQAFWKIPASKIEVIYPQLIPVDADFETKQEVPQNYFLYISSFTARKNHLFLLKAFAKHVSDHNYNLIFAGIGGNMLSEIKAYIKQYNLETRVIIKENVNENEKAALIKNCKAFLYPSLLEGFGLPLTEALQFHKPVFCSDISVFREAAGKAACFLPHELEAWSDKLMKIAGNSLVYPDSAMIENTLEKYNPKKLSEQLMKVYEGVL